MQAILRAPELSATSRMVPIWIMARPLRSRLRHDLPQPPTLQLRQRPGLLDPHAVADLRGVLLVVRVEAARALDRARVLRVLHPPLDLDDDRLVHLVRDHAAELDCPVLPGGLLRLAHLAASPFSSSALR